MHVLGVTLVDSTSVISVAIYDTVPICFSKKERIGTCKNVLTIPPARELNHGYLACE